MSEAIKCQNCGRMMPANAPAGQCPACLFRIGIALADGGLAFGLDQPARPLSGAALPPSSGNPVRSLADYELLEEIAGGGMGFVYRARQLSLNREVALKLIRAGELANALEVARFRAEAAAAAHLDHPNIVPIYEVGEQEGRHYFSMKLIEGGSLSERMAAGASRISNARAAELLAKVARAVHYAHQRGILHRDLKPGNVLIDAQGEPHVSDFGLAKRIESNSGMTVSGAILGTPSYIAPEQAAGVKVLTTAADVYSLGAILYELLAGRPPFAGATVLDTLLQVREREPIPPRVLNPRADRDLEIICLKCLRKEPSSRYRSAEALAEDLERWLARRPIHARATTVRERVVKWVQRKPGLAAAVAAVVIVALAGLTGTVWQWRNAESARQDAVTKLWNSYLAQARARRTSGVMGQRTESLAALRAAAQMRPSLELRDEAIATLALRDLQPTSLWRPHASPMSYSDWAADASARLIAVRDHPKEAIRVWPVETGEETELSFNRRNGRHLRFSRDGEWLAAHYYGGEVVLWDWRQRRPRVLAKVGVISEIEPLDFSHDGEVLGVSMPQSRIRLFRVKTGAELAPLTFDNQNGSPALSFNPRRAWLAVGSGSSIQVWDYEARRLLSSEDLPSRVFTAAWHPDGRRLAFVCWRDPDIRIWDMEGSSKRMLHGVTGTASHLSFHPGGDLLACRGSDGVTRLWDLATEQLMVKTDTGLSMEFSRDGKRLVFDREMEGIGMWEVVSSRVYGTFRAATGLAQPIEDVKFSPDARLMVWGGIQGLGWLDRASGQVGARPSGAIRSLAFHPSGESLFASGDDGLEKWTVHWAANKLRTEPRLEPSFTMLKGDVDPAVCVRWSALSADGKVVAMAADTWVAVIPTDGAIRRMIGSNVQGLVSVGISPDRRWIASGEELNGCFIYQVETGSKVHTLDAPSAAVTFDPRGRWLITGTVKEYSLWELGTWRCLRRWPRQSVLKRSGVAAFTPDGTLLAVTHSPDLVRLLNPETGVVLATLTPPSRLLIRALAFSPDGGQLAAASDGGIVQVWQLAELRRELRGLGLDWPESASPIGTISR